MRRLPFGLVMTLALTWMFFGFALLATAVDDGSPQGELVVATVSRTAYNPPDLLAEFEVDGVPYVVSLPDGFVVGDPVELRYPPGDPGQARPDLPARAVDPGIVALAAVAAASGVALVFFIYRNHPEERGRQRVGDGVPTTVWAALLTVGAVGLAVAAAVFITDPDAEVRESGVETSALIVATPGGRRAPEVRFVDRQGRQRRAELVTGWGGAGEIGDRVRVRYLADDPGRAVLVGSASWIPVLRWSAVVLMGMTAVVGAIVFVVALGGEWLERDTPAPPP